VRLKKFILGHKGVVMSIYSKVLLSLVGAAVFAVPAFSAETLTFDVSATHQKVEGFGGGVVYYQNWIMAMEDTAAVFDTAFTGLGLSFLRMGNWMQNDSVSSNISSDVAIYKAAKARLGNRLKVEMSSWTAPDSIKASGKLNGIEACDSAAKKCSDNTLSKDGSGNYKYASLANWWKKTYQAYTDSGIKIDYVSLQNEPDMNASYAQTLFDPTEDDSLAGYAQALAVFRDTMNTLADPPKILGPEVLGIGYNNFENYTDAFLSSDDVDGYAFHMYHAGSGNDNAQTNYGVPSNFSTALNGISTYYSEQKPMIMTEYCTLKSPLASNMLGLARVIREAFIEGNVSGYIDWELLWGGEGDMVGACPKGWGSCGSEDKLIISPEYHGMRQYSKFVGPGWYRIDVSLSDANLEAIAFTNNSDSVSVIVINPSSTAATLDYAPDGYGLVDVIQSTVNGKYSKQITLSTCAVLPDSSVTTFVFKKGATAPTTTTCEDETSEPDPVETVAKYVIADFTNGELGSWTSDVEAGSPSLMTTELDGFSSYVYIPFANCTQSSCGYQDVLYTLADSIITDGTLEKCSTIYYVAHAAATSGYSDFNAGAAGDAYIDSAYGISLSSEWDTIAVDLSSDSTNASTKLKFNSNYVGMYLASVLVSGCTGSSLFADAIPAQVSLSNKTSRTSAVYDLRGRLMWKGILGESDFSRHELKLKNLRPGVYMVKTRNSTVSAVKK